jgi:hypothetical protein
LLRVAGAIHAGEGGLIICAAAIVGGAVACAVLALCYRVSR